MGEKAKVRYAVVGLGNIAQVAVLPAFRDAKENSELVALVSSDAAKLEQLCKRYGVRAAGSYDELERVLATANVHAVYVAVPNRRHREIVERAARAGVHVLCEKPLATTEEDCAAMIRVTREHQVKLMVAYRLHFEAANLDAIERIRRGEIGEPKVFSSVFCHQVREGDIRTRGDLGGGALFDLGVYCINAARYLFQDEPTEALGSQTFGSDERSANVDEMTSAVLRFPGNRVAQFVANQGAADVSEFRVVGTRGDIRLDPAYEYSSELREFVTKNGKAKERTFPKRDQFAPELVYFSDCILRGTEPEPSGDEGLADVRIMEAIVGAARTGSRVPIPRISRATRPAGAQRIDKPPTEHVQTVHAPPPSK